MPATVQWQLNRFPEVPALAQRAMSAGLLASAQLCQQNIKRWCPVSAISDAGHIHMVDTIDVVVNGPNSVSVTVGADYGAYVEYGTDRMFPRLFATHGFEETLPQVTPIFANILTGVFSGSGGGPTASVSGSGSGLGSAAGLFTGSGL